MLSSFVCSFFVLDWIGRLCIRRSKHWYQAQKSAENWIKSRCFRSYLPIGCMSLQLSVFRATVEQIRSCHCPSFWGIIMGFYFGRLVMRPCPSVCLSCGQTGPKWWAMQPSSLQWWKLHCPPSQGDVSMNFLSCTALFPCVQCHVKFQLQWSFGSMIACLIIILF